MSDMLSQEEINALIAGSGSAVTEEPSSEESSLSMLTDEERDALGEIGNISMGTAATTLFTLLNQKVTITTPRVSEASLPQVFARFDDPCVTISVKYTVGLSGNNLMIVNSRDVKVITDLMLGGDGTNIEGELNEMHLSAIGEAMNQMIGSSSTSLSEMMGKKIDISPPIAVFKPVEELTEDFTGLGLNDKAVIISFAMKVGDLVDSEIMQMMPLPMARALLSSVMPTYEVPEEEEVILPYEEPVIEPITRKQTPRMPEPEPAPRPRPPKEPKRQALEVDVRNVQFESFGPSEDYEPYRSDIEIIRDVPLEISVELGRTKKKISDILDFVSGSIVELDRLVGEPLDILANGKTIAKGEVVVIEENYGIRITEIVLPDNRLS